MTPMHERINLPVGPKKNANKLAMMKTYKTTYRVGPVHKAMWPNIVKSFLVVAA